MSSEAQLQISLKINKSGTSGNLNYQSYPTQFTSDVDGALGPTPGAFLVSVDGTDVDLSQLTTPGLCRLSNQDGNNFVTYGLKDPVTNKFYPLGELLPGEFYVLRLSRVLGWGYSGSGTGTSGDDVNKLHFIADIDPCVVLVEAFEA